MTNHTQQMDMFKAVRLFFVNYFDFSGRASRGEFWWAYLAFFIVSIILAIIDAVIGGVVYGFTESEFLLNNGIFYKYLFSNYLNRLDFSYFKTTSGQWTYRMVATGLFQHHSNNNSLGTICCV